MFCYVVFVPFRTELNLHFKQLSKSIKARIHYWFEYTHRTVKLVWTQCVTLNFHVNQRTLKTRITFEVIKADV